MYGETVTRAVRRSMGIAKVPRQPSPPPASRRHLCRGVPARVPSNQSIRVASRAFRKPKPCPGVLECLMAGCRHGPEMGTHRGDGRWTVPAGGCTRSVSSLGSLWAVPGVFWAFARFSAGSGRSALRAFFLNETRKSGLYRPRS